MRRLVLAGDQFGIFGTLRGTRRILVRKTELMSVTMVNCRSRKRRMVGYLPESIHLTILYQYLKAIRNI